MSYVDQNLAPDEQVVYRSRLTWVNWIGAILLVLLLGWLLGLGILLAIALIVRQLSTEIAVTNRRFVYKTGWISRTVHDIHLAKVEGSNLQQGLLGRILGYGTFSVHGTGVGSIDLPNIDDPNDLKRAVEAGAQGLAVERSRA
jgi:uncharacterized membrane protein YdbT with pleckstrin-like domain